ncbi:MAG: hypothetical protein A2498_07990 [Lentisphaerae bacterium RIFOXYC12_FULL_60_16]|nr:MAG: hypothetical protein A2498_07990 [Lentisphaerae bacterium RIFOXYC12_FULL_60_16]OGV83767.1 MAG: hypothetical protein A2340_11150 [Lentisphaerae bacterium RIFOXYB12_FULL_60_10]
MTDQPRFTSERGTAAVQAGAADAARDLSRPRLHFRPPSGWMNDPNGTLFHDGWYHVFYQHHPYSPAWDSMHWGHARSRDLVRWEHRPVALCPQTERGEQHCFSGCTGIRPDGSAMILYTSIGKRPSEQWAALGSEDLDCWVPYTSNPLLALGLHGNLEVKEWRDPFIFKAGNRDCLALGGYADGAPVVLWYEAALPDWSAWTYRGILYRHAETTLQSLECPNFFPVGDRWVLCYSPYRPVEVVVGTLDEATGRFDPETHGRVDLSNDFYATNVCRDSGGRTILYGWVRGFSKPQGWNGVLSIPRVVTLGADGHIRQNPVPEWESLRTEPDHREAVVVGTDAQVVRVAGCEWEMDAVCRPPASGSLNLRICDAATGRVFWTLRCGGPARCEAAGTLPIPLPAMDDRIRVRLFFDRTVAELFVDDGSICVTRVFDTGGNPVQVEAVAEGGEGIFERLDTWRLKPVWED